MLANTQIKSRGGKGKGRKREIYAPPAHLGQASSPDFSSDYLWHGDDRAPAGLTGGIWGVNISHMDNANLRAIRFCTEPNWCQAGYGGSLGPAYPGASGGASPTSCDARGVQHSMESHQ